MRWIPGAGRGLVAALIIGCAPAEEDGGMASDTEAVAGTLSEPPEATPTREPSASAAEAPLTVSDLDAYVRGVRAEIGVTEKAWARLRESKSGADTLSALFAATPDNTQPEGASAAGLSLDRYRVVTDRVDRVLAGRDMGAAMAKQRAELDTTGLDSATRAIVRRGLAEADAAWGDPYKDLLPDVADAFKKRTPELDSLRLRLAGLRLGGGRAP